MSHEKLHKSQFCATMVTVHTFRQYVQSDNEMPAYLEIGTQKPYSATQIRREIEEIREFSIVSLSYEGSFLENFL